MSSFHNSQSGNSSQSSNVSQSTNRHQSSSSQASVSSSGSSSQSRNPSQCNSGDQTQRFSGPPIPKGGKPRKREKATEWPPARGTNYDTMEGKHRSIPYYFLDATPAYEAVTFRLRKSARRLTDQKMVHYLQCSSTGCKGSARIVDYVLEVDESPDNEHQCMKGHNATEKRRTEMNKRRAINDMKNLARTTTQTFDVSFEKVLSS